jgi:predicted nucleic acid-binding protein
MLYVESSALLAWLFTQPNGERIRERIESAADVTISALTELEVERALARDAAAGNRPEVEVVRMRGALAREKGHWMIIGFLDEVLERAGRRFPVEPVRTLDAIHLATALALAAAYENLEVLTLDSRIAANLRALGLTVA